MGVIETQKVRAKRVAKPSPEDVRALLARFRAMPATCDAGGSGIWRRFARERRTRSLFMLGLMAGLRGVYARDEPFFQLLRNTGVRLANDTLALKRQFIREALGFGPLAGG